MFRKRDPKRNWEKFIKRYPNLKMVVNDIEVPYPSKEFLPFKVGENSIYLKDGSGATSETLKFDVDFDHSYHVVIDFDRKKFYWNIKIQLLLLLIITLVWIPIVYSIFPYTEWLYYTVCIIPLVILINYVVKYLGAKQDISVYLVRVAKTPQKVKINPTSQ